METLNPKNRRDRCSSIRWKGLYIVTEIQPDVDSSNDTALWCSHTFTCLGPDGRPVDHEECGESRDCYDKL